MSGIYLKQRPNLSYAALQHKTLGRTQGTGSGVCHPAPFGIESMRTVAAVVALVACVHAGLWLLWREKIDAPNFDGQLSSVPTHPSRAMLIPRTAARPKRKRSR